MFTKLKNKLGFQSAPKEEVLSGDGGIDAMRVASYKDSRSARQSENQGPRPPPPLLVNLASSLGRSAAEKAAESPRQNAPSMPASSPHAVKPMTPALPVLGSPLGGSSSRRKSTPAALDMALRTAEGRAVVDELLHSKQVTAGVSWTDSE